MGRYIFNQNISQMVSYFGLPTHHGEQPITLDFPTHELRQRLPNFPENGRLEIIFVQGKVQRVTVRPNVQIYDLFTALFQYEPRTEIVVFSTKRGNPYFYSDTRCMGDGVGADTQATGDKDNFTSVYYSEDFVSPYNLLEQQHYSVDWQSYPTAGTSFEYPWLSERLATEADIETVDYQMVYIMHHSIYARRGLIFYNSFLRQVFESQAWYKPLYEIAQFKREVLPTLSTIEQSNLDFLFKQFDKRKPLR